ncbi:MAG: hypothetical protein ACPGUV_13925 [Polyangiales bacterium]
MREDEKLLWRKVFVAAIGARCQQRSDESGAPGAWRWVDHAAQLADQSLHAYRERCGAELLPVRRRPLAELKETVSEGRRPARARASGSTL